MEWPEPQSEFGYRMLPYKDKYPGRYFRINLVAFVEKGRVAKQQKKPEDNMPTGNENRPVRTKHTGRSPKS